MSFFANLHSLIMPMSRKTVIVYGILL